MVTGVGETRIPYRQIAGVNHRPAGRIARGSVYFNVAGTDMKMGPVGARATGAMAGANSFAYMGKHRKAVEAFLDDLDTRLNDYR
jgi:hypothetical protein